MAGIALLIVNICLIVKLFKLCQNMQELRDYLIDGKKVAAVAYYDKDTLRTIAKTVYGKDLLSPISKEEWIENKKKQIKETMKREMAQPQEEVEKKAYTVNKTTGRESRPVVAI